MTGLAKSYGAVNSHFVNPDGWDNEYHYTTVRDLANIFANAMKFDLIREITGKVTYSFTMVSNHKMSVTTTNNLICPGGTNYRSCVIGGKTGYTDGAGRCLIVMMEHNGLEYIVVGMGFDNNSTRNKTVAKMIDYVCEHAG